MKHLLIVCVSVLVNFTTQAQQVDVIDFAGFQQILKEQPTDETVVYNFWATWCKPCVEEMPYFEQLQANYKAKGLKVVFVSLDFKSKLEKVTEFVGKKDLKAEVVLLYEPDFNSWIDKVSTQWSGAIPATLVVHGDRKKFHEGQLNYLQLEDLVKPLL